MMRFLQPQKSLIFDWVREIYKILSPSLFLRKIPLPLTREGDKNHRSVER